MLHWDRDGLQRDSVALRDGPRYGGPGDIGLRAANIRSLRSCVLSCWLLPGCILVSGSRPAIFVYFDPSLNHIH